MILVFSLLLFTQVTPVHPLGLSSGFASSRKPSVTPSESHGPHASRLSTFHTLLFVWLPHQAVGNVGAGEGLSSSSGPWALGLSAWHLVGAPKSCQHE